MTAIPDWKRTDLGKRGHEKGIGCPDSNGYFIKASNGASDLLVTIWPTLIAGSSNLF